MASTNPIQHAIRRLVAPALLGFLAICGSGPGIAIAAGMGEPIEVMMPPNELIHRFQGQVTVMNLPHKAGNPMLSLSSHANGRCAIWLPRVGEPGITQELYECLAVIEVANCNGAVDINTPAVKARSSSHDRAQYSRTCSRNNWSGAFNAVREPAMSEQIASAATSR
jgi:hypothetical protein